jgi:hypothetical protein
MFIRRRISALSAALAIGAAGAAFAAEPLSADIAAKLEALEAKVQSQQTEIERLRSSTQDGGRLDQRRAEEIRELIREVLADADTRASLLSDGATAGYDSGFWVGSADGANVLKIGGEGQVRFVYNNAEEKNTDADETETGFQLRRFRLNFSGNFINKNLTYGIRLALDRATGNVQLDNAFIAYQFAEGWKIQGGSYKAQFLREENVSGFAQLAVERSYVADYFTLDYVQGAELSFEGNDFIHAYLDVYDGSYTGFGTSTEFNADLTEIAVSARVEGKIAGDWKQFRDFTVSSTDKLGILVGAAAAYEVGENGRGNVAPDIFKWTADVSIEAGIFSFFAAVHGQHFDDNNDTFAGTLSNLDGADQIAFVIQGGVYVVPDVVEVFARYEWIDFDGVYYRNNGGASQSGSRNITDDELGIATVGVNYYVKKHNVKFTLDVLYAFDPVPVSNTGGGLLRNAEDGQVGIRFQGQFRF